MLNALKRLARNSNFAASPRMRVRGTPKILPAEKSMSV